MTVSAKAGISCSNWQSGTTTGKDVYSGDFQTGNTGGDYNHFYDCSKTSGGIQISCQNDQNMYHGSCTVVYECKDGKSYYCNVDNWNGKDCIDCSNQTPDDCNEIKICQRTCVPEPSTILAGAMKLIPFGISTLRILRKGKMQVVD